jgi:capsular polysaccharide biosynthesis protein
MTSTPAPTPIPTQAAVGSNGPPAAAVVEEFAPEEVEAAASAMGVVSAEQDHRLGHQSKKIECSPGMHDVLGDAAIDTIRDRGDSDATGWAKV